MLFEEDVKVGDVLYYGAERRLLRCTHQGGFDECWIFVNDNGLSYQMDGVYVRGLLHSMRAVKKGNRIIPENYVEEEY